MGRAGRAVGAVPAVALAIALTLTGPAASASVAPEPAPPSPEPTPEVTFPEPPTDAEPVDVAPEIPTEWRGFEVVPQPEPEATTDAAPAAAPAPALEAEPDLAPEAAAAPEPAIAGFAARAATTAWSGTFLPWDAERTETTVNTNWSIVAARVEPATSGGYTLSVYRDDGVLVCNTSNRNPDGCAFSSIPPTDGSMTYTAYVALDSPAIGPPTQDVRAVSEPLTITNTGWHGELVQFETIFGTDWYQGVQARVEPRTAGGYHLAVYTEDGQRVCMSTSRGPDSCGFISRLANGEQNYYAVVGRDLPLDRWPDVYQLLGDPLNVWGDPDPFVYVALGDSFQSGEGVGNSIAGTADYLGLAYENGTNYPEQIGTQVNTYSVPLGGRDDQCHRALENYAKIHSGILSAEDAVALIDVTCSSARIEPSHKPAIVGTVGAGIDPGSQVAQALARLEGEGLTPADVDLVTVGMGGNDAGFQDIVNTCLGPNLLRQLVNAYPDTPLEVDFLANHVASCANIDVFVDADRNIEALLVKERWAQEQLLSTFPNARVLQLNYPIALPAAASAPAWCGGVSRTDIGLLNDRASRINGEIAAAVAATNDPRLELVDVSGAFGANGLCPGGGGTAYVSSFDQANVDAEVARLLNLDGTGDVVARAKLDSLVTSYQAWKGCVGQAWNPFGGSCDVAASWDAVGLAVDDVLAYLGDNRDEIMANMTVPPGAEPVEVRYDRSRGVFHPNGDGQQELACYVSAAYDGVGAGHCGGPGAPASADTVNGAPVTPAPVLAEIGQALAATLSGFDPWSLVKITFFSEAIPLGEATADADGTVALDVIVPDTTPGVHRVSVEGVGADGVQVIKEFLVEIPGEPVAGESFGVYLEGFEPARDDDGVIEIVDVTVYGVTVAAVPDAAGGVFVEVPLPEDTATVDVSAVSRDSGLAVTEAVEVVNPDALEFGGFWWLLKPAPEWNTVAAGRAVPLLFEVFEADGSPMRDAEAVAVRTREVQCETGEALGEWTDAASANRHDAKPLKRGWWMFVMKTAKADAGTCAEVAVMLDHGGSHSVLLEFPEKRRGWFWRR